MAELRYNPLLGTWTMVAGHRQGRPNMPKDNCPFCSGSGKVPDNFDVLSYDNDFPALSPEPPEPDPVSTEFYRTAPAAGKCEVILYGPDHHVKLHELPLPHVRKLVDLWAARSVELSRDPRVKSVFPFENRGEEVGVTMPHPHGQIYAYPFVPQKLAVELENSRKHRQQAGECLVCRMNSEETAFRKRIIHENPHFLAYLPFFTDYPYGVFLVPKRHRSRVEDFPPEERDSLAEALKTVTAAFDALFDRPFPFMMCVHQAPVNSPEYEGSEEFFHFHVEFYPPLRDRDRIKYYASSETGMWAAANVVPVEKSAAVLRNAKYRVLSKSDQSVLLAALRGEFAERYGDDPGVRIFQAPGRVNLIGEHIDYNGGMVLPAAIDLRTWVLVRPRRDKLCTVASLDVPGIHRFEALPPYRQAPPEIRWADYPLGILHALAAEGNGIPSGFDALFFGTVPAGAGLSSSAALEVAFASAMNGLFGFGLSPRELAFIGKRSENEFAGVPCGIMDQYASACGKAGHALLLDCADATHTDAPFSLPGTSLVIVNTNKRRELSDSRYSERLSECRRALSDIRRVRPVNALCEISPGEFATLRGAISDPVLQRRAMHAITENARVKEAAEALAEGDAVRFGALLNASHDSLRDDYEVTGRELDALVDAARGMPFVYGARMTGAGFGGCAIALVREGHTGEFRGRLTDEYRTKTGLYPSFYFCSAVNGAGEVL
jgi:UDPglucose--hexose-1-phosphate uridylyltransferase